MYNSPSLTSPSRIAESRNLTQNFDLSAELPDLAWKIVEKLTFYGIREIFAFLVVQNFQFWARNFHVLRTEFLFSEPWILGEFWMIIFIIWNLRFLNAEYQMLTALQFLRAKFAFSENFLSTEFWVVDLENFFSAKLAFSELIPIFECNRLIL